MKVSKKAVVEIKGGFGNQIFQYMFAKKLKNEGYDVKINTRFYNQFNKTAPPEDTFRSLILPPSYFGFKEIGGLFFKLLVINNKISKSRKIKKLIKKFENPFYIHVKDKNIENMPTNKIIYHLIDNVKYLLGRIIFLNNTILFHQIINNSGYQYYPCKFLKLYDHLLPYRLIYHVVQSLFARQKLKEIYNVQIKVLEKKDENKCKTRK